MSIKKRLSPEGNNLNIQMTFNHLHYITSSRKKKLKEYESFC